MTQRHARLTSLLAVLALLASSCGDASFRLVLSYPSQQAFERARLVKLYVGEGEACPALQDSGTPPRLTFDAQGSAPAIGDVETGLASFWAVVSDANCQVFAEGCAEVEIDGLSDTTVRIYLQERDGEACVTGESCQGGRCVSAEVDAAVIDGAGDAGLPDALVSDTATADTRVDIDASDSDAGATDAGAADAALPDASDAGGIDVGIQVRFEAAAQTVAERSAAPPNFAYRRQLSFDNSAQTEDLVDFPVLLRLEQGVNFDYPTRADGADLRFIDGSSNILAHEIQRWDPTGVSLIWVKVPFIAAGSSSDFAYMHYGAPDAADVQDPAGVWSSGYVGVWHLDETSGDMRDSSASANDCYVVGPVGRGVAGPLGGATSYDPNSPDETHLHCEDLGTGGLDLGDQLTIEAWIFPLTEGDDYRVAQKQYNIGSPSYGLLFAFGQVQLRVVDADSDTTASLNSTGQPPLSTWSHIAASYSDAADRLRFYIDGAVDREVTTFDGLPPVNNDALFEIGGVENRVERTFPGSIDEVRLSSVERSPDWMAAQYLSMTDAFATLGPEEALPLPAPVTVNAAVALEAVADSDVEVPFTVAGSANAGDHDLVAGSLTILQGELTAELSFQVLDDALYEGDETVAILLGAPTGAALGTPETHTVTITDDEPLPALRIAGAVAVEGELVSLAVAVDQRAERDITFTWSTIGDSATAGDDFTATTDALATIAGGALGTSLEVLATDDALAEPVEEQFLVQLANPTNASLANDAAVGGIVDDDDSSPTLDLDLSDCAALPAALSFSRASTATYVDASGDLVTVAVDQPRCESDPDSGEPLGLLIEGEATNLWVNSRLQSGDESGYSTYGSESGAATVTAGGLLGNGDYKMSVRRIADTGYEGFRQHVYGLEAGATYTFSFVAEYVRGWRRIYVSDAGDDIGLPYSLSFDLTTSPRRYAISFVAADVEGHICLYVTSNTIGNGFDLSHMQLEKGSYPSSIIINDSTTGPATRAADLASVPIVMPQVAAGTVAAAVHIVAAPARPDAQATIAVADDGSAQRRLELLVLNASDGRYGASAHIVDAPASMDTELSWGQRWPHDTAHVVAVRYSRAKPRLALYFDGEVRQAAQPLPGDLPSGLDRLLLGRSASSSGPTDFLNGHILWLRYWPRSVDPDAL